MLTERILKQKPMKTGLNRRTVIEGDIFESPLVNVFDILKKEKVFTGSALDAANFIGVPLYRVRNGLKRKDKINKKWAVRYAKQNP